MKLVIIVEHQKGLVKPSLLHVLTAAKKLSDHIDLLVIGHNCKETAESLKNYPFVDSILVVDNALYEHELPENVAKVIVNIASDYDYVLAAASTYSKNILPRAAALLDESMLSDVAEIISADTFVRPIYAGNILATVQTNAKIKIMTIRATLFQAATLTNRENAPIKELNIIEENSASRFVAEALTESKRPDLTAAKVVISGGRGLKSKENFQLLESLADQLGAAIGASRAAVDAGFAPNDYQVGQTGKIVAPDLYFAIGISGAIQHLAGMKDSKVVVAINNDPEAPIFQVADYILVGDLFTVLPELKAELSNQLNK